MKAVTLKPKVLTMLVIRLHESNPFIGSMNKPAILHPIFHPRCYLVRHRIENQ